jgi:hypothetical protein
MYTPDQCRLLRSEIVEKGNQIEGAMRLVVDFKTQRDQAQEDLVQAQARCDQLTAKRDAAEAKRREKSDEVDRIMARKKELEAEVANHCGGV